LHTLLTTWPTSNPPLLVFLHEVPTTAWVERLLAFPATRLVLSAEQPEAVPTALQPTALLLSRLAGDLPPWLQAELPDIRPTDLRRLPPNRLVFKQGEELCTLDMGGGNNGE
jgi:hypothetical protein